MAFTPKPPTSVRSIRLSNETWAWLGEEAGRRDNSVNGLVSDFIAVGRLKVAEAKAAAREAPKPKSAVLTDLRPPVPYGSRLKKR